MLVPLTRKKFEEVIPLLATGSQYGYYWGNIPDLIKRLLISVVGIVAAFFMTIFLGSDFDSPLFCIGLIAGLYWLWGPVYLATVRNYATRRNLYAGFWRGEILDIFVSEELIGEEQTVNNRGQLVIVENRERRLNVEVGDDTGFFTQLQVPLRRTHKLIKRGQIAEAIVMSNRSDLSSIVKVSDIYLPDRNLWVSDYPYLGRNVFAEISRQLQNVDDDYDPPKPAPKPKRSKGKSKRYKDIY